MSNNYESVMSPAGRVLVPIRPPIPTKTTYEVVSAHDLMPHYQQRSYSSVAEAAAHRGAGDYVIAVEDGWMRSLTPEEEAEFQR
jgi:hypothetical protein